MVHKSVTILANTDAGEKALKKVYKAFKGSDVRERMMGRGVGVSVETLDDDGKGIKIHFRKLAAKFFDRGQILAKISENMKELDCIEGEDYTVEVSEI